MVKKARLYPLIVFILLFLLLPEAAAAIAPPAAEIVPGPLPHLAAVETRPLAQGVTYRRLAGTNGAGQPLVGHLVEVDGKDRSLELRPVLAGDRLGKAETVSALASRYGALAAVNGGFFARGDGLTMPVGNVVIDGRLLAASDFWRTSFGLTRQKKVLYGFFAPQPVFKVAGSGTLIPVGNLNRPYRPDRTNLYQAVWGERSGTPPGTRELILLPRDGRYLVTGSGQGNSPIPPAGMVLAGDPAVLPDLAPGTVLTFDPGWDPAWQGVHHLLTGGPLLVEGGRPVFQAVQEGFSGTVLGRRARTAIGVRENGNLLLVVVEGGEEQESGVTLEEMAVLLGELGAATAVGLDGGGSSAMWVAGQLVSRPATGTERPVANALVVLRQIPVYLDGWRLPCDVPPALVGGRVLVPLRAIFQGLGAAVHWDEATREITAQRGERQIRLTVGEKTASVDGRPVKLDVPAQVVAGRTLVPVRFVSQALGAAVEWRAAEREVHIFR